MDKVLKKTGSKNSTSFKEEEVSARRSAELEEAGRRLSAGMPELLI
jgi:hypothetical protein